MLLLNEIGLDPGIDHCSALALVDSLKRQGKEVVSFTSFCGGLPAPECAEDVPLGYKFSWNPRGVLTAALNEATFRLGNQVRCGIVIWRRLRLMWPEWAGRRIRSMGMTC